MKRVWILAVGVALAGCQQQQQPSEPQNSADTVAPADNVAAKVAALSDKERNAVMIRAILDAGMDCRKVTKSVRIDAGWRATCASGESHLIQIHPDGSADIISAPNR